MAPSLFAGSRGVIVAIDHPLYMWPTRGLEDQLAEELRKLDADDMYRQVLLSTLEER